MTKPVVACRANSKVADAAVLMLKHKVHRIPIVDEQAMVVGIVSAPSHLPPPLLYMPPHPRPLRPPTAALDGMHDALSS